jgi:phosphate starvation-inducible PhoH-like protein
MARSPKYPSQSRQWTRHDIKQIQPLTANQRIFFDLYDQGKELIALHGYPGTGKTFLALYHALKSVFVTEEQDKIIIVRSAVAVRDIGFLPGTEEEKIAVYQQPYVEALHWFCNRASTFEDMVKAHKVEFITTSFLRGLTIDNAVIVVDEAQNLTMHELDSIITRAGQNTRIVLCGDTGQTDLRNQGYGMTMSVMERMEESGIVVFSAEDIVRSGLVKSWIIAKESC